MNNVTVKKDQLRATLVENLDTHIKDFEIAWEAYHKAVLSNVESLLKRAKKAKAGQPVDLYLDLETPKNHSDDYERAIEMLDWEQADTVDLTESEFRQLVQDKWSWKGQFEMSNSFYTGSISPSKF